MKHLKFLTALFFLFSPAVVFAAPPATEDCLACHDSFKHETFKTSVHSDLACVDCHSGIQDAEHPEKLPPVNCASCHEDEVKAFRASDHRHTLGDAPGACLKCHGDAHAILPADDVSSPIHRKNIPRLCASCHEDASVVGPYGLVEQKPYGSYLKTVHGQALAKGNLKAAVCSDCHGAHAIFKTGNPLASTSTANVPQTCGHCHEAEAKDYAESVHGSAARAGRREAPVCTDCHGEHSILSPKDPHSSVYATVVSEKTCGQCHGAEKIASKFDLPSNRLKTYLESYHGMARKFGVSTVANCASCHGAHKILPSKDPRSSVYKKNLVQTCGKCHPNVGEGLAEGKVHVDIAEEKGGVIAWVRRFYWLLIFGVIGGMLLHNFLDFTRKMKEHHERYRHLAKPPRFNANERIQHVVLFVSFTLLAYSGFALKYPDAWWAAPLTAFDAKRDWRGVVHRAAAIVFSLLSIYHAFYLLCTPRGRMQLRAMMPSKKDLKDFWQLQRHNLGAKTPRPRFARYNYIEKAEYWALAWGSLVMIVTGFLLTFENLTMRYFPKWWIDAATAVHFYEAVLATLAIVVWHFYFTIFDPEHYPLNMSIFSGKSREDRDEKPGEGPKKPAKKKGASEGGGLDGGRHES